MEITETKHEFVIGEYTARVFWGEYGTHTDWFKGNDFLPQGEGVPEKVEDKVNEMIEEMF